MNNFLKINKKLLLVLLILIILIFFSRVFFKNLILTKIEQDPVLIDPTFDVINPSITINNNKEKIFVKANMGNFINNDLILLEKNVYFESQKFKIFSDKVTFNRKDQTAISKSASTFKSKGTEINSEGFSIIQKGDIIMFNGKTSLILTQ